MKKRGQSEILITILLVLIVLAGIVIVGVFIKNSVGKGTLESETQIRVQTMNLKFDIKSAFINRSDNKTLFVSVFRESGSQETIDSLKFVLFDKFGKSYSYVDTYVSPRHKALETKVYVITAANLGIFSLENITRVWIYYGLNSSIGNFIFSNLLDEYGYNNITNEGDIMENFQDENLYFFNSDLNDTLAPASITNLKNISAGTNWIYWNWTNPSDIDFLENLIYINGQYVASTGNNYYNATGLASGTNSTISVKTKDLSGNVNNSEVNNTAKTLAGEISIPLASCGNNIVEAGEACDGTDLNGYTCATVAAGFVSGSLSCNADCKSYNVNSCVKGNVINAVSCSQDDVQAAIDSASDGDTVQVPAGTCVWVNRTSRITRLYGWMDIYSPVFLNKSIILKGAGQDETIIFDDTSYGNGRQALYVYMPTDKPVRITGMSFENGDSDCAVTISNTRNFRVDHLGIYNSTRGICPGDDRSITYGLFDHIYCENYRTSECFGVVLGDNEWEKPFVWGTAEAVYMEDIYVNFTDRGTDLPVVDCRSAGRYVLRNSYLRNGRVGNHGTCETNNHGCTSTAAYDNIFVIDGTTYNSFFGSRSGTSVVYNNNVTTINRGAIWHNFQLNEYRTCPGTGCYLDGTYWGFCNGSSINDGNFPGMAGYPCKDQVGRTVAQKLMPVFEWNNTKNGTDIDFYINDGCPLVYPSVDDHVKKDRDYYEDTVIYNSQTQRYEATYTDDDGSLKQWTYTPYVYPHPLSLINN
jgi:hypothetical protein